MTVIRLYTKIINTSDFAGKLIQSLRSKGYRLNVICDKTTIDKFVSKNRSIQIRFIFQIS